MARGSEELEEVTATILAECGVHVELDTTEDQGPGLAAEVLACQGDGFQGWNVVGQMLRHNHGDHLQRKNDRNLPKESESGECEK